MRRLAAGRRVLDLCCYSGGFALSAAAGGASAVTGAHACLTDQSLEAQKVELVARAERHVWGVYRLRGRRLSAPVLGRHDSNLKPSDCVLAFAAGKVHPASPV